jgi:hypothetical protein
MTFRDQIRIFQQINKKMVSAATQLKDGRTLQNYSIDRGSTLHLIERIKGMDFLSHRIIKG